MDQELVQYLDGRFQTLDERFNRIELRLDSHDQRFNTIDQRFDRIEQRLDAHDRRFDLLDRKIDEKVEEVKRHTGVLVEGLRHEVQLVAEGLTMHIQVQHAQEREYFDRKFEDTHALIRSSYGHLQQQQDQLRQTDDELRQRVENLERNQEN